MESQVQLRFANTQLAQGYMFEETRQNRVTKFGRIVFVADADPKACPKQRKGASGAQDCGARATG